MSNEELILDRLDRLEQDIAPMADSARSIVELREDLAPRVNEAVKALIEELVDVEADFQLEDLLFLIKKAMRNVRNFTFLLDQLKNLIDLALTAEPLLKSTVPQIIYYFDDLEQRGVFRVVNSALDVMKKIGTTYTAEDMEQIGEGLTNLLGIAKKLADPETVKFLNKAAELPAQIDLSQAQGLGPCSMFWALGTKESKEGLGVLVELTRGLAALK